MSASAFMSSAGRPDILQCIRCRDRDADIAVLHGDVRCLPLISCLVLDGLTSLSDSVSDVQRRESCAAVGMLTFCLRRKVIKAWDVLWDISLYIIWDNLWDIPWDNPWDIPRAIAWGFSGISLGTRHGIAKWICHALVRLLRVIFAACFCFHD
jgi:hypothetical protein